MDKLIENLRHAVANLRMVAMSLHMPLDVSEVDKAMDAVDEAAKPKSKAADKPAN